VEAVTAGLTAVLVAITAVYAWLTWVIAKRSGESADAAKAAAEASLSAAQAARTSALIAEATLPLSMSLEIDRHSDGNVWLTFRVAGASVWIHGARLTSGLLICALNPLNTRNLVPSTLNVALKKDDGYPFLAVNGSSGRSLDWPGSPFRAEDYGCAGTVEVQYSLARDSDVLERLVHFACPDDIWDTLNRKTGALLDLIPRDTDDPTS